MQKKTQENKNKSPTFFQMVGSVLWAMFGVQNQKTRERDFERGNPWAFIFIGIFMALLFVLLLVGIVKLVLSYAV